MKPIPSEFTERGIKYTLKAREGAWAVFEQRAPHWSRPFFETVKLQSHQGYTINGVEIPSSEYYPSAKHWGNLGFTYHTEAEAIAAMHQLALTPNNE